MRKTNDPAPVAGDAVAKEAPTFDREQILHSKRWAKRRDALENLLKDGRRYTASDVESMLTNYMKGQVK